MSNASSVLEKRKSEDSKDSKPKKQKIDKFDFKFKSTVLPHIIVSLGEDDADDHRFYVLPQDVYDANWKVFVEGSRPEPSVGDNSLWEDWMMKIRALEPSHRHYLHKRYDLSLTGNFVKIIHRDLWC